MRFLALFFMLALTACGTATENVTYALPPTPGGRMCAHQCLEAQDYCTQTCSLKQKQCVMTAQQQAVNDYDQYTRDQYKSHQPIEFRPSDFERVSPCNNSFKTCAQICDRHYQSCYEDCGGTVNLNSSCQFLCF